MEFLDRFLDGGIEQLYIVLFEVALLVSLSYAILIDGEFLHVLGDVLLCPEDGDHVDGGVFAF